MSHKIFTLGQSMVAAWEMLIDFPVPKELKKSFGAKIPDGVKLIGFPLVGMLCGGVLALAGQFCATVFNPIAGGVIFSLLTLVFWDLKDSGRSLGVLGSFAALKFSKISGENVWNNLNNNFMEIKNPASLLVVVFLEIFKFAVFFLLYRYSGKLWLVMVLAGGFSVQGYLTGLRDIAGSPILAFSPVEAKRMWVTLAVISLFMMLFFGFSTFFAFLLALAAGLLLSRYYEATLSGVNIDVITFAGAVTELLLLFFSLMMI